MIAGSSASDKLFIRLGAISARQGRSIHLSRPPRKPIRIIRYFRDLRHERAVGLLLGKLEAGVVDKPLRATMPQRAFADMLRPGCKLNNLSARRNRAPAQGRALLFGSADRRCWRVIRSLAKAEKIT